MIGIAITTAALVILIAAFNGIEQMVEQLYSEYDSNLTIRSSKGKTFDESTLTQARGVGRAQIPSTVIGLYVHTAEHVMRHSGQLLVTARILKGG